LRPWLSWLKKGFNHLLRVKNSTTKTTNSNSHGSKSKKQSKCLELILLKNSKRRVRMRWIQRTSDKVFQCDTTILLKVSLRKILRKESRTKFCRRFVIWLVIILLKAIHSDCWRVSFNSIKKMRQFSRVSLNLYSLSSSQIWPTSLKRSMQRRLKTWLLGARIFKECFVSFKSTRLKTTYSKASNSNNFLIWLRILTRRSNELRIWWANKHWSIFKWSKVNSYWSRFCQCRESQSNLMSINKLHCSSNTCSKKAKWSNKIQRTSY
jgi:hypothetical protein